MSTLPIGEVARHAGLAPSAIRYYEKAGLLPRPGRQSGQRRYGAETAARLKIIALARDAGFTVAETRTFLSGFSQATPPAARWRALAERKLAQLEERPPQLEHMLSLLTAIFDCRCPTLGDCERALMEMERRGRAGR